MAQYIDKEALVAEIERRIKETESMQPKFDQFWAGQISAFKGVLKILDTLEVKEVGTSNKVIEPTEWSKEDDKMLDSAIGAVYAADYYTYDDKEEIEHWLKSLKQRLKGEDV